MGGLSLLSLGVSELRRHFFGEASVTFEHREDLDPFFSDPVHEPVRTQHALTNVRSLKLSDDSPGAWSRSGAPGKLQEPCDPCCRCSLAVPSDEVANLL